MMLQDLLLEELTDLYDAELQLLDALPRIAGSARGHALRAALTSHLEETRQHIARLEEAFALLGKPALARRSSGIAGILEAGARMMQLAPADGAVSDAGLIAAAQKAEHYEISAYGTCVAWARTLGLHQVAAKLQETLQEEAAADQALSDLAEQEVNISASHEAT